MITIEENIEVGLTVRHAQGKGYNLTTFQEEGGTRYAISTLIVEDGIIETMVFIAEGNWVNDFHEVYSESYGSESVAIIRHDEIAKNLTKYLN